MTERVLVTGGSGLIGRRVVSSLAHTGYQVTVFDRAQHSPSLMPAGEVVVADTRDWDAVARAVKGKDVIVHLAAGANFLMYEAEPVTQTSAAIVGFHHILEAAKRFDVRKVVYASTSAVYEGNQLPYTESMPLHPPDLKAVAKKINEEMAHLYSSRFGTTAIGLRPFSVYGADEAAKGPYANIISLFAWAMLAGQRPVIWGDGEQTRDFIYVDDVVEAFRLAVVQDIPTQEFNVGTGIETSFNDIVKLLNESLPTALPPVYVAVPVTIYARRLLADTSLAQHVLHFRAQVSVKEGIQRVLQEARILSESKESAFATMQRKFETLVFASENLLNSP